MAPFDRPTLAELREQSASDAAARFGLSALLPRSALLVLSEQLAGVAHGLHGHLEWLSRAIFADSAEALELERLASVHGVFRKAAAFAEGTVTITGPEGTLIPAETFLRRADGVRYRTETEQEIPLGGGGTAALVIVADEPGTLGNAAEAVELTFATVIGGVDTTATVDAPGLAGGAERESDLRLRERLLQRLRNPPQSGAAADYERWALEVSGVTRAFVLALNRGPGTVDLTFAVDDDPDGPFPSAAKVAEVQAYIDGLKPVTADVVVFEPAPAPLNPTIEIVPDTTKVREAVTAALEDLIRREAGPGATLLLSHVREAISTAPGETDHTLVIPFADTPIASGALGTLGTVTWQ